MKYKSPLSSKVIFFQISEFHTILALSLKFNMTQHPQTNHHVFILKSSGWMNHNFRTHGTFSDPSAMGRSRSQWKNVMSIHHPSMVVGLWTLVCFGHLLIIYHIQIFLFWMWFTIWNVSIWDPMCPSHYNNTYN